MKRSILILFLIGFAILSTELLGKNITVVLDWTPNTNHTGLYVALSKGYFKAEGLEVEILQPSGGSGDQIVASGRADFGISYQENVIFARIEDVPIVSLAAIVQHNTSGFAALKSKKIKSPKDWAGKNYGGWGSPVERATLKTLIEQDGGDFKEINILTTGSADFFQTSRSSVDFAWVFAGWTNIEAKLKGFDLDFIPLRDYDSSLDYYTPVIITNEKMIKNDKEVVAKFMKAVRKGYEFAILNPLEAGKILLQYVPELDRALVLASAKFLSTRYRDDAPYWGRQKKSVWLNYQNWLFDKGLIKNKIDIDKAYTNKFLGK